jgi:hypothetical protein
MKNAYKVRPGKANDKIGRHKHIWEDHIKKGPKLFCDCGMDLTGSR